MSPPSATEPVLAGIARLLAIAGGLVVVALAVVVTTSVLMRWLAGSGMDGDFELVQMGLALAAFAFLPICQARRGNVLVDTFTTRLPLGARHGLDALWDVVYGAFAAFIAWRLALGAIEAQASRTTSMMLALPIHYAIGACSAMAAFLALVCVVTAIRRARERG